ncbi:MAG: DEAD/DEAH box helicase [Elusimicrobiota bacterium]|jgi:ATP-dependent RNA helicase RhlE
MSFKDFSLRPELQKALEALSFHVPTPIQKEAIPIVLSGRDLLASAQTGTGKTLAFLLPLMHRMLEQPAHGVTGLVLLPTRELAAQVASVGKDMGRFSHFKLALLVGGESYTTQLHALRSGANLVIATPGRLLDHLERRTVSLSNVHTLVLDEADRMLDMGFAPALHAILRYIPEQRHTLLFSATLPNEIERLSHLALKNPIAIRMAPQGTTAETVTQHLFPVMRNQKADLLLGILRNTSVNAVLIFCRTKRGADRLARFLQANDLSVIALHADRTQAQRAAALHGFKTGKFQIMVATDIAARGLDVRRLSHVINFDVPQHTEDYVHRVGRTGRHFEVGDAYTLVAPDEERDVAAIERFIGRKLPRVQLPDFPYEKLPPPPKPKTFMERFGRGRRFIPRGRFSRHR